MATKRIRFLTKAVRLCPVMLACDGTNLQNGREVCTKCEKELARRERLKVKPLRGTSPTDLKT